MFICSCAGWLMCSGNRKRSMLTAAGLDLLVEIFTRVAPVNQMSAQPILSACSNINVLPPVSSYHSHRVLMAQCVAHTHMPLSS